MQSEHQNIEATRSIDRGFLIEGGTATVTVTVTASSPTRFSIIEEFSPAFRAVSLVQDGGAVFSDVRDTSDALFTVYDGETQVELKYEVTATTDVGSYSLDGSVDQFMGEELTITGETEIPQREGPPPVTGDSPPRDLNGDGLFRDLNGDGTLSLADVQVLFQNRNDPTVREYAEYFNFDGQDPAEVSITDVQQLFEDFHERSDGSAASLTAGISDVEDMSVAEFRELFDDE